MPCDRRTVPHTQPRFASTIAHKPAIFGQALKRPKNFSPAVFLKHRHFTSMPTPANFFMKNSCLLTQIFQILKRKSWGSSFFHVENAQNQAAPVHRKCMASPSDTHLLDDFSAIFRPARRIMK
jgi:hypothetical protein